MMAPHGERPTEQRTVQGGTPFDFSAMQVGTTVVLAAEISGSGAQGNYDELTAAYQMVHGDSAPARSIAPLPLVRDDGTTLFTTSGIQTLYGAAFHREQYPEGPFYINQPVVRMNYFHGVGPSSYTSFINPGIIEVGASFDEHCSALSRFVGAIRAFAAPQQKVTVNVRDSEANWSADPFPVRVSRIAIDGLEVADAIYTPELPTTGRPGPSVSEFGMGRERLLYVAGQDIMTSLAGRQVGPAEILALDAVRTAVLIAGSGVAPANKDHGGQLRRLVKRIVTEDPRENVDLSYLIKTSHSYWQQFGPLEFGCDTVIRLIRQESERIRGTDIINRLAAQGVEVPKVDTTRGVLRTQASLRTHGVDQAALDELGLPADFSLHERRPPRTLIVSDYDSGRPEYTFPTFAMGAAETRIWQLARSATEIEDLRVVISGPNWLPEYVPGAEYFPRRITSPDSVQHYLSQFGRADFLFGGHEFFDKPRQVQLFKEVADNLISYQGYPYVYKSGGPVFDAREKFLFVYSDDFMQTYAKQKPIKLKTSHTRTGEDPYLNPSVGDHLIWVGRLDAEKAPHLAIQAAAEIGRRIVILGKTVEDPGYGEFLAPYLSQPHVDARGVLVGAPKMEIMTSAAAAIYTVSPGFQEAAAGVISEYLTSGVPLAGVTWRGNDAICEAVDRPELGEVVDAREYDHEGALVKGLAAAISRVIHLDRAKIHEISRQTYDPVALTRAMLDTVTSRSAITRKFPD